MFHMALHSRGHLKLVEQRKGDYPAYANKFCVQPKPNKKHCYELPFSASLPHVEEA